VQDIGDFWFPVNPEEIACDFGEDNDYDTDVIGVGEIVIPGTSKLESVGWSSFLPNQYDAGYVSIPAGLMHEPNYAMQKLIETKRQRSVCFLVIGGTPWNDYVVIKSLKWSAKAGEPNDIYYDIEFKRYRDVSIQTVEVPGAGVEDPRDAPTTQPAKKTQGDGSGVIPTDSNPDGNDGTNDQHVDVNADPTTQSTGTPAPTVTDSLGRLGSVGSSQLVQENYPVGYNQSLEGVYEDLKRQGFGAYNTLESLASDNKDSPTTFLVSTGSAADRKPTVGAYATNEPLPVGTFIKYWKTIKVYVPPVTDKSPGSAAAIASGGPAVTAAPGSPAAALLAGQWPWNPDQPQTGGGSGSGGGRGGFG